MAPLRTVRASFPAHGSPVIAEDTQHRFSALHYAYLSVLIVSNHLFPFALLPAFPDSLVGRYSHDYYGNSVTLELAPLR